MQDSAECGYVGWPDPEVLDKFARLGLERHHGRAKNRIESSLGRAVAGGKLDAAKASLARERIGLTTDLEAIAGADLVIEAVPENRDLQAGRDAGDRPHRGR